VKTQTADADRTERPRIAARVSEHPAKALFGEHWLLPAKSGPVVA